jgi:hypothetical protein
MAVGWPEESSADGVRIRMIDPAHDSVLDGVPSTLVRRDFATDSDIQYIEARLPQYSRARALYLVIPQSISQTAVVDGHRRQGHPGV